MFNRRILVYKKLIFFLHRVADETGTVTSRMAEAAVVLPPTAGGAPRLMMSILMPGNETEN